MLVNQSKRLEVIRWLKRFLSRGAMPTVSIFEVGARLKKYSPRMIKYCLLDTDDNGRLFRPIFISGESHWSLTGFTSDKSIGRPRKLELCEVWLSGLLANGAQWSDLVIKKAARHNPLFSERLVRTAKANRKFVSIRRREDGVVRVYWLDPKANGGSYV